MTTHYGNIDEMDLLMDLQKLIDDDYNHISIQDEWRQNVGMEMARNLDEKIMKEIEDGVYGVSYSTASNVPSQEPLTLEVLEEAMEQLKDIAKEHDEPIFTYPCKRSTEPMPVLYYPGDMHYDTTKRQVMVWTGDCWVPSSGALIPNVGEDETLHAVGDPSSTLKIDTPETPEEAYERAMRIIE